MQSPQLRRPEHLDVPGPRGGAWLRAHAAGLAALVCGAVGFIVVTVRQGELWSQPDWRITVPIFVATLVPTAVAFVRKEPSHALPLLGLGLAAAAMVLGWFFVTAAVVVGTGLVILVLSHMM